MPVSSDPAAWVDALAGSHDHLCELVADLDPRGLDLPSYCTGWSIAGVLSHLGSSAEIFAAALEAAVTGGDPPDPASFPAVWDRWNALSSERRRDAFFEADGSLIENLERLGDELDTLRIHLFGMDLDAVSFLGMRLGEHALHSWDIAVTTEPTAGVDADAAALLVDRIPEIAPYAGKADAAGEGRPFTVTVATTGPERSFSVRIDDAVSVAPDGPRDPGGSPLLVMPAEAFLRLVYGRLDAAHTPQMAADPSILDRLRGVFQGL